MNQELKIQKASSTEPLQHHHQQTRIKHRGRVENSNKTIKNNYWSLKSIFAYQFMKIDFTMNDWKSLDWKKENQITPVPNFRLIHKLIW